MSKILGLDLGTNSIGWTIIDDKKEEIIHAGVRIFQEGVNRSATGSEISKNADRRLARGIRRQNFRFKRRRDELVEKLIQYGMYPESDDSIEEYFKDDPYKLRTKGLDEKLNLFEFGRVLYHLNERRGFKSNRKTKAKDDSKIYSGKDNTAGITDTENAIKSGKFRTLGEYLASLNSHEQRIRNRYTLRKMYQEEFELLWNKQKEFYPGLFTDEIKNDIYDTIFFQRKLKSQKHTVGYCTLEPKKRCIPKSSPSFQYFRILEQVSRLRISTDSRINDSLTEDERFVLIKYLELYKDRTFDQIKKKLKLATDCYFNLEHQNKLFGDRTSSDLSRVFTKSGWSQLSSEKKYEIWHTLHFSDDDEWLEKYAREKWNLDEKAIEKLLKISLEKEYARLSHKAINKMIPYLEEGLTYDQAALKAGYHHSKINLSDTLRDFLPEPENIRNPIVQQTIYELRKVVNDIIQKHGKPDIIRVELLRQLKLSKKRRDSIHLDNLKKKRKNEEIRNRIAEEFPFIPSREDIQKYLLWEECNNICPYTGKQISLAALYNGEFEIEHIIPYSRSLDNSMGNKTLCYKGVNLEKGNKTPFEAFSGNQKRWDEMCQRVYKNLKRKYSKFTIEDAAKEINEDFFEHQFTDSAYIAREVFNYLKMICKRVQVSKGLATAQLRHLWGLDKILSGAENIKNREDHRHHVVDALVIANISPTSLKNLSNYHKFGKTAVSDKFPIPWSDFRTDALDSVNNILVSHKVNKRVRGRLHEETFYGKIKTKDGKEHFVVRKPLTSLSPKNVGNIVDPVVRKTVLKRLREYGVNTETKFKIPKEAFVEPLTMPTGNTKIKSVRVLIPTKNMIKLYDDRELYVEPGKNNHIEIFRNDKTGKQKGRVVSLFEATQRLKNHKPIIDKTPLEEGYRFLMSLSINELVLIGFNENDIDWNNPPDSTVLSSHLYRVQKMDVNNILTFRHHIVSIVKDKNGLEPGRLFRMPGSLKAIKVRVDSLGNIRKYND